MKGVEDSRPIRRRHHVVHRERTDSASSSSIYFTASQGLTSSWDNTTEGGYSTACAESNFTDRDTDREERGQESDDEEEEEEEDRSCATVLTIRQEESPDEDDEEEEEKEGRLQLVTEAPNGELTLLLAQSDILHTGDASLKAEGFRLLLETRAEVRNWTLLEPRLPLWESLLTQIH
ncbi:regulator of microtubule dynamics protein 3 [Nematolebias whitei]|uniref:regulator of microtubule dynamics protein 3 n=1 Tax=Nematolebias whitei TaxID=451745 RepID=UPI00189993E4|nr:regulator of microtubule dynamics protein 3 [Nematolebias whitei]